MIASPPNLGRTRVGLLTAAFLAPFSATHLVGPLTLGRAAALAFAALLAIDLVAERPTRFKLDPGALLLVAGYVGLTVWIYFNMAAWGCNCYGKAAGFLEVAAIGVLALVALGFRPQFRRAALVATLAGLLLAAVLALLGVGAINSGTVDLTQTGGRLSGSYGNANELGFAVALGIPIVLAYFDAVRGRAARVVMSAALLVLTLTLFLTYSRGSIVGAAVGVLVFALWRVKGSRRRVTLVLAVAVFIVVGGAALYSAFERGRRDVSFEAVPTTISGLSQRDLSGWDSRPRRPIPNGPSTLSNADHAIAVRSTRSGEGISIRWGEAEPGGVYALRFKARSETAGLPLSFALADSAQAAGTGTQGQARLGPRWQMISLRWRPPRRAPHANVYIWQQGGRSQFELGDVTVTAAPPRSPPRRIKLPDRLEGSIYAHLKSAAIEAEERYVRSRIDAAREALDAFRSEPLRGIGWTNFPAYAAAHLEYGQLAAHNQYLSVAAELGLVGLLLLAMLVGGAAIGVFASGARRSETAAVSMLATAAAGMVFVEALPVPQLSIAVAIAAAVVCAPRRAPDG